jgi:hypothetical protein
MIAFDWLRMQLKAPWAGSGPSVWDRGERICSSTKWNFLLILHQKAPIDRQITPLFWAFNVLRIINLRIVLLSTLLLSFAAPALADPTVGLGLTLGFGGGQPQAAVGLRVFSDNKRDKFAGTVGVDYVLGSQSWRGTVGAAYLDDDIYIGVDLGYGLSGGGLDFSIGAGGVKTV